jgi:hypothetical protein
MTEIRMIPFRRALPAAELLVCALLVWPFVGFLIFQMRFAVQSHSIHAEQPVVNLDTGRVPTHEEKRAANLFRLRMSIPALLNLPCVLLGLARREFVPKGVFSELWHAITWPVVGVIFWWIAGRGIDALLACRRRVLSPAITWFEVFVASIICACCLLLCFGFLSDPSARADVIYPWPLVALACGLWVLLGVATISARLAQWRIRRQLRVESESAPV